MGLDHVLERGPLRWVHVIEDERKAGVMEGRTLDATFGELRAGQRLEVLTGDQKKGIAQECRLPVARWPVQIEHLRTAPLERAMPLAHDPHLLIRERRGQHV